MGYMTDKFKGIYELRVPLDEEFLCFNKDEKGKYLEDDIYISCGLGKITHYGYNTMTAFIVDESEERVNRTQVFNRIVKEYKDIITDVLEGDGEGCFNFNVNDIEIIAKAMKARTKGKNSSPFAKKYLPSEEYEIPKKDDKLMKSVTARFIKNNKMYLITQAYREFAEEKGIDITQLSHKMRLKHKEVFHKLGYWEELVSFINNKEE